MARLKTMEGDRQKIESPQRAATKSQPFLSVVLCPEPPTRGRPHHSETYPWLLPSLFKIPQTSPANTRMQRQSQRRRRSQRRLLHPLLRYTVFTPPYLTLSTARPATLSPQARHPTNTYVQPRSPRQHRSQRRGPQPRFQRHPRGRAGRRTPQPPPQPQRRGSPQAPCMKTQGMGIVC